MTAAAKGRPAAIDAQRLTLAQTVLLAAAYDQLAERSGAPRSELILSDAGLDHGEIAAATGRNAEAVRSSIRRYQKSTDGGKGRKANRAKADV
jgi:DNA-directed RNA polymerase specialized sigma24 family protein